MKSLKLRLILILIVWPSCTVPVIGQGQVGFFNTPQTLISTNALHGGAPLGPTAPYSGSGEPQFVYALFAAPSTVTSVSGVMDPNWTFTGVYATNTSATTGGRLSAGITTLPPPYASGYTFAFLVRGWSSSIAGQDWASAQVFMRNFETDLSFYGSPGQLFGTSGIAVRVVEGIKAPITPIFGVTPGATIPGFLLDQVSIPEPCIPALFALGSIGLLSFRQISGNPPFPG